MAARTTYYGESLGESTTTSAVAQDKVTVTFTPDASTSYFVFYSARQANSSNTTNQSNSFLLTAGISSISFNRASRSASDRYSFFGVRQYTSSASPVSSDFKLRYSAGTSGDTTRIQDARLFIVKRETGDQYAESSSESTTTSTSFQTKVTLTFTPASQGDYLIFAYGDVQMSNTLFNVNVKMDNGGTAYGNAQINPQTTSCYTCWGTMVKLNLAASSQTFTVQYNTSNGSGTAKIKNACIVAIRLDTLDNSYYAEARSRSTTGSSSYQDKTTLTQTPTAKEHVIFGCQLGDSASTIGTPIYGNLLEDSTTISECFASLNSSSDLDEPFFMVYRKTLAASSTTWKTQYHNTGGFFNVGSQESAIAVLQTESGTTTHALTGTVTGASSVSGALALSYVLTGTISAASAIAGTLFKDQPITGTISGTSAISGALGLARPITSTISAASDIAGTLILDKPLSGIISAASGIVGSLAAQFAGLANIASTGTVQGTLGVDRGLTGTISGSSNISGTLSVTSGNRAPGILGDSNLCDLPP